MNYSRTSESHRLAGVVNRENGAAQASLHVSLSLYDAWLLFLDIIEALRRSVDARPYHHAETVAKVTALAEQINVEVMGRKTEFPIDGRLFLTLREAYIYSGFTPRYLQGLIASARLQYVTVGQHGRGFVRRIRCENLDGLE